MCPRYIDVTDGRTDGRTTYDSNTARLYVHRAVKTDQVQRQRDQTIFCNTTRGHSAIFHLLSSNVGNCNSLSRPMYE